MKKLVLLFISLLLCSCTPDKNSTSSGINANVADSVNKKVESAITITKSNLYDYVNLKIWVNDNVTDSKGNSVSSKNLKKDSQFKFGFEVIPKDGYEINSITASTTVTFWIHYYKLSGTQTKLHSEYIDVECSDMSFNNLANSYSYTYKKEYMTDVLSWTFVVDKASGTVSRI